VILEFNRYEG